MREHALLIVLVCAGVTLLLRALPFWCFGGKRGMPRWIAALGGALPSAIMAALVVYCLRGVPFGTLSDGMKQLLTAAVVVGLHIVKRNTLLSVAGGTAAYMLLLRL